MRPLLAPLLVASVASAMFHRRGMEIGPIDPTTEYLSKRAEGFNGWDTFDQLLDHSNPQLGTFKQRYWYGTEFWKGPGSPIILTTPGEQTAEGFNKTYFTTQRLAGLFAKELGGAVILLEHRYWGQSSPFEQLTVENLQYLTLDNSIKDLSHLARELVAPFDTSGRSSATEAPWVYTGCSYGGALASWSATMDPGTIWAYHGSSGPVEAISDFWRYFTPVLEASPQNCSADVQAVIEHVDVVLMHGTSRDKVKLKERFKLGDLTDADFGVALEWGPWKWQENQFHSVSSRGYSPYHQFCDYVENMWPNSTNKVPGAAGVGLQKALDGYAKWFTERELPGFCQSFGYADWKGELNTGCFQGQNGSNIMFRDLSVNNSMNRQWAWMLCNEPFEFWQDGAPVGEPTLVSRLVTADYWREQCGYYFPAERYGPQTYTYGVKRGKRADSVNQFTGGWFSTNATRLMYSNGELDPWRDATVSSHIRPGGPFQSSSEDVEIRVIPGGTHCSDLYGKNWAVNEGVKKIVDEEVATMRRWVGEFYVLSNKTWPGR